MKKYIKLDREYKAIGEMKPVKHGLVDYTAEGTYGDADCEIGYTDFGNGPEATHIFIKDHYKGDTHYDAQTIKLSESIDAAKSAPGLHQAFDDLDERFTYDLDDEFEIYVRNDIVPCYAIDSHVFGDGAGIGYTIAIPIGEKDFWDIDRFIQKGLEEYFTEQLSGSDYTWGINEISKDPTTFEVEFSDVPSNVDTYNLYFAQVDVVPYQNIGPYGDYGIDFGVEE